MNDIPEHDAKYDRIMGVPNKDCDDGQVRIIQKQ